MKNFDKSLPLSLAKFFLLMLMAGKLSAQDSTELPVVNKVKPVKNTFESVLLMDNQTVMVPVKGTFEWDFQHRFGTVKNGSKDLWGVYGPANIRMGLNYAPIKKLYVGAGLTKERMQIDVNAKYAIFLQTPDKMPVSVTYFGNAAMDTRGDANYKNTVDRFSYFTQLIIGRKVNDKFSVQVAPNFSWFNNVEGYVDSKGEVQAKMHNEHFAVSLAGRYKISEKSAIIAGWINLLQLTQLIILIRIFVLGLKRLPVLMRSRYFLATIKHLATIQQCFESKRLYQRRVPVRI